MNERPLYIFVSPVSLKRTLRKMNRRLNRNGCSIFILSFLIGLLASALVEQNWKLSELEMRLRAMEKVD